MVLPLCIILCSLRRNYRKSWRKIRRKNSLCANACKGTIQIWTKRWEARSYLGWTFLIPSAGRICVRQPHYLRRTLPVAPLAFHLGMREPYAFCRQNRLLHIAHSQGIANKPILRHVPVPAGREGCTQQEGTIRPLSKESALDLRGAEMGCYSAV